MPSHLISPSRQTTSEVQGSIVPAPNLLLSGVYEDQVRHHKSAKSPDRTPTQCTLEPVTACQPAINQYVAGNFSTIQDPLERAVNACSAQPPAIIVCVGQNDSTCWQCWCMLNITSNAACVHASPADGGATAALCGYWASQKYPTAQVTVVTFASNWSVTTVNFAFIAKYGRFVSVRERSHPPCIILLYCIASVLCFDIPINTSPICHPQYTLGVLPTAQQLLNSSMIRDSPGWVVSGTDCDVSPYCKANEAVNASCTLLADGDPNSNVQFLQSYPGAVVLYDRDRNATASAGGVPPKQTASVMWCVAWSCALVVSGCTSCFWVH